ncbi:MAG TPA: hypothetical protein VEI97_08335 [bacterium]|nr:hypothetical protein [bacterium]
MANRRRTSAPVQQPHPLDCVFHGLREAPPEEVLAQHGAYWASVGGLPQRVQKENRVVCRGVTYAQATEYLGKVNQRLLASRRMLSAFVVPFVVGYWPADGESLGFPVEVWMTEAHEDKDAAAGLWDIVDRSLPLYRLPWMYGMGWVWDRLPA